MFDKLKEINTRPRPFQFYTAEELWANEHTSEQMLKYHLNEFEANGFRVEELYSDVAGNTVSSESTEFAIVAKKSLE